MPPTMQSGIETSQNILQAGLEPQVARKIMLREADIAPIYTIAQGMRTEPAVFLAYL